MWKVRDTQWNVASMWNNEFLTNRRAQNLIAWFPLKFLHSAITLRKHFADTRRHTFAWCDSCFLTTRGWKDLLHKALESVLFYNAQIQLQWAVRKMQTSVETLIAYTQTQHTPRELSVPYVLRLGWPIHRILVHGGFNGILLGRWPWALQTPAWWGLDLLLR